MPEKNRDDVLESLIYETNQDIDIATKTGYRNCVIQVPEEIADDFERAVKKANFELAKLDDGWRISW